MDERRADKAEDGAGEGDDEHVEPAHLVGHAEHPGAGDGEGETAGDHGARGHDGVGDVGLIEARVAQQLEEEQRDDGGEDDRPGERAHLERRVGRARRDDHAAEDADDDAAQRKLPAQTCAVLRIAHICLLCVYPLPLDARARVAPAREVGLPGPAHELARPRSSINVPSSFEGEGKDWLYCIQKKEAG